LRSLFISASVRMIGGFAASANGVPQADQMRVALSLGDPPAA
jgi:hypothetical protein